MSIIAWFIDTSLVQEFFVYSYNNFLKGRVWTLGSSLFIHSDFLHFIMNMIFLFVFARTLEEELTEKKMVGSFFLGGILTFIFATPFYQPETTMVGASAAIFTLAAITMLVKPLKFSIIFLSPVGVIAILYFLINVITVYYGVQDNVSYIGHVIGFVIGIPFGIAWSKKWKRNLLITVILLAIYYLIYRIIFKIFFS
jgi:membrane associated rhomboid family serine protease